MNFSFEFDDLPDPITVEDRTSYIERIHVEYDSFLESLLESDKTNKLFQFHDRLSDLEEYYNRPINYNEIKSNDILSLLNEMVIVPKPRGTVYRNLHDLRGETIFTNLDEFRVYRGFFPYSEHYNIGKRARPMIPYRIGWDDNKWIVIPLTSVKERTPMHYDIKLIDWEEAGLDNETRVRVRGIRRIKYVSMTQRNNYVSNRDLVRIRNSFDKMISEQFIRPEAFYGWLMNNEIKYESVNNNLNKPIRTLNKVKHEKAIDCLELAIITYKMCINCNDIKDCGIGFGIWIDDNNHKHIRFFTIFKANNQYWTVQYLQTRKGYIERHDTNSIKEFIIAENSDLSDGYYKFPKLRGKRKLIKQGLLFQTELRIIAEDTSDFKTHRELLNFLDLKNRKGL